MAKPSFNNVGLRRDLNLSDLENPELALNNVLNNLVVTDVGQTFSGGDLDAIKGISNSTVTNTDIAAMANLAVKNAYLDPETQEIIEEVAIPTITIKNQLDTITATTNDPPFFNGGDGLFADFYELEDIKDESLLGINSQGDDILVVTATPRIRKKYWTNGLFEFSNKLDEGFEGANGLIQWEGWYVPDSSGTSTFNVQCSGFLIIEVANENDSLQMYKNIYKTERRVFATAATIESDRVSLTQQEAKTIAVGDRVTAIYDANGDPILEAEVAAGILVDGVGSQTMVLDTAVSLPEDARIDVTIEDRLGGDTYSFSIALQNLTQYVPRRVRFTLWWPGNDNYFNKVLDMNLSTRQRPSSGSFPYWYLYSQIGEINTDESFKGFYDKRLLMGGGVIGPEDPINSTQYNDYGSIAPLAMRYSPPKLYSDILRASYRYSTLAGSEVISTTTTSRYTDNIEIGNKVFANVLPNNESEVVDIARNSIVITKDAADNDSTQYIDFIDHRGFAVSVQATSTGDTVSTVSNEGIRIGDVVVTPTYAGTEYIRVTALVGGSQFRTSVDLDLSVLTRIFIYRDKGLSNQALDNYCIGVVGKEVAQTATAGSYYIELNNVDDIATNRVIQSSPFTETVDPNNTSTLTKILEINPPGYPTNTVRIDKPIQGTEDMVAGTTVVICPANTTENKEACVIPLNTAPPFVGTAEGLRTTDGTNPAVTVGLELANASGKLRVIGFNLQYDHGPIKSLDSSTLVAGSNYDPVANTTTYENVALTGGTGTGATADITVVNGEVSSAVINNRGTNYLDSETLSANLTGGSGFSIDIGALDLAIPLSGSTHTYDRTFPITIQGVNYKILATTTGG
jgi:hypothetical protein